MTPPAVLPEYGVFSGPVVCDSLLHFMKLTLNTILFTGGGSGIGRGLAEAFHALGNQVIISGRNTGRLQEVASANPGMQYLTVDMTDPDSIASFAARLEEEYPTLNVLFNNAGVMIPENVLTAKDTGDATAMVTTNLLGPIRLTTALLPLLRQQPGSAVINVTSGLAFVPLAMTPTYSATKAALHSYTESLRHQLKDTTVEVIELAPPYVATELMGEHQATDPRAMPLGDFIAEVMGLFETQPTPSGIYVERVQFLRTASHQGPEHYAEVFKTLNGHFG
jgi:uncharacterized oxidoreductase